jgi:hypothetical protein
MKKILKVIAIIILIFIISFTALSLVYLNMDQYAPSETALATAEEYNIEKVDGNYQTLNDSTVGLIMYPGAKVDPIAYSYLASTGYNVFIIDTPYNIAMFQPNEAQNIMDDNPQIESWYIMGHSLGGVVAYNYETNPEVEGIISLASYPLEDESAVDSPTDVLGLFAANDGLVSEDEREGLPKNSQIVILEGNHAGFGNYGVQEKDDISPTTSDEQNKAIVNEITKFVEADLAN